MDSYSASSQRYLSFNSFSPRPDDFVLVDNCSNVFISNNLRHFTTYTPFQKSLSPNGTSTVCGSKAPSGMGTVRWAWYDDNGKSHTFDLPNCRRYPDSPVSLLSSNQLGKFLQDTDCDTTIESGIYTSTFYWSNCKYHQTIQHTPNLMPRLPINDSKSSYATILSRFLHYFDDSHFSSAETR